MPSLIATSLLCSCVDTQRQIYQPDSARRYPHSSIYTPSAPSYYYPSYDSAPASYSPPPSAPTTQPAPAAEPPRVPAPVKRTLPTLN